MNKLNKSTKLFSAFCAIACATMLSSNSFASTGGNSAPNIATSVQEVVRINLLDGIQIPDFMPDAGAISASENFCLYSNDKDNAYPTSVAAGMSNSGHIGTGDNSADANRKFNLSITSNKLVLAGGDHTVDKHVVDYFATISAISGVESVSTDCTAENYKLTIDLDAEDIKDALAGSYSTTVDIDVSVQ